MYPILGINDNPINLALLDRMVKRAGLTNTLITASDGQQALNYYATLEGSSKIFYPRLVFLDLHMPIMDGWQFLDKFVSAYLPTYHDTKIIIMSSSIDPADKDRALNYTCVFDFLTTHLTVDYLQNLKEIKIAG
jgi:CheY-like chemotaxis protein